MTWHHYYDLGYYGLTKVLAEDIRRVAELGLDGYTSCAVLRAFYPHGFPMYVHSKLLWNPELRVDELAREYFEGAFGKDGSLVREYMETLSDLSSFGAFYRMWRAGISPPDEERIEVTEKLRRIPEVVEELQPIIERNQTTGNSAHDLSWKHLSVHAGMVLKMVDMLQARLDNRQQEEEEAWKKLADYLALHEDDTDSVFDIKRFQSAVQRRR